MFFDSPFKHTFTAPFCLVFEVVNYVPCKKMGFSLWKVPDFLYTYRIGTGVIIPNVLLGENYKKAFGRCVKRIRSKQVRTLGGVFYPLMRFCVSVLTTFLSYWILKIFSGYSVLRGVNPLFESFHRFELVVVFSMSFFLTRHSVDVLETTSTCRQFYEEELQEENKRKNAKLLSPNKRPKLSAPKKLPGRERQNAKLLSPDQLPAPRERLPRDLIWAPEQIECYKQAGQYEEMMRR